jgi:uncharacterized protein (UPF0264 family)
MRLLVSVRDAGEAAAALLGGADIVDAKEPSLGPLAPVSSPVLQSICRAVPRTTPLSVALGDARPGEIAERASAVAPLQSRHALFFKAALVNSRPEDAAIGIASACRLLAARADRPALVVARYVDAPADIPDLTAWIDLCAASGVRGLLLDTSVKTGPSLPGTIGAGPLLALRRHAGRRGIWLAVAGGVGPGDVPLLAEVRPDVVGVRGSVCTGGRTGALSAERVLLLRRALAGVTARERLPATPV